MKKFITFLLLLFTGCALAPLAPLVGPIVNGVVVWKQGEAHKYYAYDSKTIYHASKRALRNMNLNVSTDQPQSNDNYHLIAGESDRFQINITKVEENITRLSLRVNFMGDKPYAELFYTKVDEMLGGVEFGPDGWPVKIKE